MKVINIGNRYENYDDTLKVYDGYPTQMYIVRFEKLTGFYLEKYNAPSINEKVYGVHEEKVNKSINSFKKFDRNLGIILSGDKGIGKSLSAKMIALKALENNYPVIVVDTYYNGIASFLEKIEQEVVIMFDEFDKVFANISTGDGEIKPQDELLTLFDGISSGKKKLFVITCNDLWRLNEYLVNRPGRFHYHYRFEYPTPDEIKMYLEDNLDKKYYDEIAKVIAFSRKINLNYDCLRAIAFEIMNGEKFENAIKDLNILNMNNQSYNISLFFKNGAPHTRTDYRLDLFSMEENESIYLYDKNGNDIIEVSFSMENCISNPLTGEITIMGEHLRLDYDTNNFDENIVESAKKLIPDYLTITKQKQKSLHYNI